MFSNVVSLILALVSTAQIADTPARSTSVAEAVSWLESESHHLIRTGRRTMSDGTAAFAPQVGIGYEAFWLRDFGYFRDNYSQIVQNGQIRHLPGGLYWETCGAGRDTYQNGAYWATPTGWFVYTLDLVDHRLADQTSQ